MIAAFGACLLGIAAIALAQPSSADRPLPALTLDSAALAERARAHLADSGAKGIALAVVHADGRTVHAAAGDSGRKDKPQIDADTLFEIGSITKAFTGILVADMVRRGELALDDPIDRHLPEARAWRAGGVRAITIRQLVTHTSGLPRLPRSPGFIASMLLNFSNPYAGITRAEVFEYLSTLELDPSQPHPERYSNLGVGLLGHVLAARAGVGWQDLVRERITVPLGMTSTFVTVPAPDLARFAVGHSGSGRATAYWDLPAYEAAGALRSSTSDLARLAHAALANRAPFAEGFFTRLAGRDGKVLAVGYGWFVHRGAAGETWWHNGGTGGFSTFIGVMPSRGVAVIALSNASISVDGLALELLGQPPRPPAARDRGTHPILTAIAGLLGLYVLLRLALLRFGPRATSGWRRWLGTEVDSLAGLLMTAFECVAITVAVATIAPAGTPVGFALAAGVGILIVIASLRFARQAGSGGVPWLAEPRAKNVADLAIRGLVSAAVLAWFLA